MRYRKSRDVHNWSGDDGAITVSRRYNPSTEEVWFSVVVISWHARRLTSFEANTVLGAYKRGCRYIRDMDHAAHADIPF